MSGDREDTPPVDLPALALSQPKRAMTRAYDVLSSRPAPLPAARAHQALMIVDRDAGRVTDALAHGRAAVRLARRVGPQIEADVLATYGVTLVFAGQTPRGVAALEEAATLADPADEARILHRRAAVLALLGRYGDALAVVTLAVDSSRARGDALWEGRSLAGRSDVELSLGMVGRAARDAADAEALLDRIGEASDAAVARHNQALAAFAAGDLVRALELLDDVARRQDRLGEHDTQLVTDRARALESAGLHAEARGVIDAELDLPDLAPVRAAELLVVKARICLSQNDIEVAAQSAERARRLFSRQARPFWARRATLIVLHARAAGPDLSAATLRRLAAAIEQVVPQLRTHDPDQLPDALLLQARVARARGRRGEVEAALAHAAQGRHAGPALTRSQGWLAAALLAQERSDSRAVLAACRQGMSAIEEYRAIIGDLELRSLATRHGLALASIAATDRLAAGDSRGLLTWAERWRASALSGAARPAAEHADLAEPDALEALDPLDRDVAALRDVSRRLTVADDARDPALLRERGRLERAVRRRYRHLRARGGLEQRHDVTVLLEAVEDEAGLGDGAVLVSLVAVDGDLHALVVASGRVRRVRVGPLDQALSEAEFARFSLRRAAFGRRVDVGHVGRRLEAALLGPVARAIRHERVVVVPPADLLTAPFGVLPALADRVVTVTPSTALWLRSRTPAAGRRTRRGLSADEVALVGGPGLRAGDDEVHALAALHPRPRVLVGAAATVEAASRALDGALLGHVVAHGTFRDDAPLFSSLRLADGPLSVHDFDRLAQPPRQVVLSACDVGSSDPIGAYEAVGLVSSLLAAGSRGVVASVVPVSDVATVPVMTAVHTALATGLSLPEALLAARRSAADPLVAATAASFTAWGA